MPTARERSRPIISHNSFSLSSLIIGPTACAAKHSLLIHFISTRMDTGTAGLERFQSRVKYLNDDIHIEKWPEAAAELKKSLGSCCAPGCSYSVMVHSYFQR